MPGIKIDYVGFNKISHGATMAERGGEKGTKGEERKRNGEDVRRWTNWVCENTVWPALNDNNCLYCSRDGFDGFWETPKRETYPRSLGRFISLRRVYRLPRFARLYFLEMSPLFISCRNSDRLAYIPLRFHSVFRAPPRKDFTRCGQKKSISRPRNGSFSFFK